MNAHVFGTNYQNIKRFSSFDILSRLTFDIAGVFIKSSSFGLGNGMVFVVSKIIGQRGRQISKTADHNDFRVDMGAGPHGRSLEPVYA